MDIMKNYNELGKLLARAVPVWEPGTIHGYHGFTFGFYASQLLTRADPKKRTMGQFFKEEIATPFGTLHVKICPECSLLKTFFMEILKIYSKLKSTAYA